MHGCYLPPLCDDSTERHYHEYQHARYGSSCSPNHCRSCQSYRTVLETTATVHVCQWNSGADENWTSQLKQILLFSLGSRKPNWISLGNSTKTKAAWSSVPDNACRFSLMDSLQGYKASQWDASLLAWSWKVGVAGHLKVEICTIQCQKLHQLPRQWHGITSQCLCQMYDLCKLRSVKPTTSYTRHEITSPSVCLYVSCVESDYLCRN